MLTVYSQNVSMSPAYLPLGSCTDHLPPFAFASSSHAGFTPSLKR